MSGEGSGRVTCAINLELSHGRHGAAARVELADREGEPVAQLAVAGRIDRAALARLEQTLDELAARGVRRLTLDASRLRDVEDVPSLLASLGRFGPGDRGCGIQGLTPRLRQLFQGAGWEPAASAARPPEAARPHLEASREWPS